MIAADVTVESRRSTAEPLTEREAAVRLGLTCATLRAWRHRGTGPPFLRLGRAIRYLSSDIDEFLRANRHAPADGSGMTAHRSHGEE
jgi:predicted DNA-binding transcriptional regulator AlpA